MIVTHTMSFTQAQAQTHLRIYRTILTTCIVADVLLGLFALLAPSAFPSVIGQEPQDNAVWLRMWAIMELGLAAFALTARSYPLEHQLVNWIGAGLRLLMAMALLLSASRPWGLLLWEGLSGATLAWTLARCLVADLQARP